MNEQRLLLLQHASVGRTRAHRHLLRCVLVVGEARGARALVEDVPVQRHELVSLRRWRCVSGSWRTSPLSTCMLRCATGCRSAWSAAPRDADQLGLIVYHMSNLV